MKCSEVVLTCMMNGVMSCSFLDCVNVSDAKTMKTVAQLGADVLQVSRRAALLLETRSDSPQMAHAQTACSS